ncbi:hypothetical protein F4X86_01320, partial [Candidatus Saccharibacteria bacterium]|nr:hypothetical protein [Candidatus Saccharibacteria bacterium]
MDKPKFNPTIAFVTVAALAFVIILALILRSDSNEPETITMESSATEQPAEKPGEEPEDPK